MEFFQSLSPARRQLLLAAIVGMVIAAVLATIYLVWLRSPYKVLFTDLRPTEAATILAELDKRKAPYRLADEGRTILVPAKTADATRLSVAGETLPLKGTVGFELFNKSDMGLTEFAQQINYRRALQGELARTIMTLEGVESARVHLSLSEAAVFREDRRPPKASVTVVARAGAGLAPAVVRGVQELVAAAVPDLDVAHVVVLDGHGAVISAAPADVSSVASPATVEAFYANLVQTAVRPYLENRRVSVQVTAPPGTQTPRSLGETLPARSFPIRIRIEVQGGLTPSDRSQLQQVVIQAAGLDPSLGDALLLQARGPDPVSPSPMAAPSSAPDLATVGPGPNPLVISLALGAVLLVLLLVAWRLHMARPQVRRLTDAQKDAYAARLQRLLSEEAGRASAEL